ncbi:MAG: hypothetical protein WDM77_09010 [Steroidobacteraceae bacterium]
MTNKNNWRALIFTALIATTGHATTAAAADCTRKELAATVNTYFKALTAHHAKSLPLTRHAGFTENGMPKDFGEGFWKTAGAVRLKRSALDTQTCGTVTQAIIEEDGKPIIFGVRLKLVHGRISEAETILARAKEFAFKPQGVLDTAAQDWEGVLPVKDRTPREVMIKAAHDYYDMFAKEPTASVPFGKPCDRWENGTQTTKNGDCSPKGLVIKQPPRRIPVVDEQAGIVVAFIHFAHSLPDLHMFKMKDGKVILVQAVIGSRAPSTGWPVEESPQ